MLKMRSPALLLILASLLTLGGSASAGDNAVSKEGIIKSNEDTLYTEEDKQRRQYYKEVADCCSAIKVLASGFKGGGLQCGSGFLLNKVTRFFSYEDPNEAKDYLESGCLVECFFRYNDFLTPTNTILEEKFRKMVIENADETEDKEAIDIIKASLDLCFGLIKKYPVPADMKNMCYSNSHLLIGCIGRHILLNCPEENWTDSKDNCKGKRIELRETIAASEKRAVEAIQKKEAAKRAQEQLTEAKEVQAKEVQAKEAQAKKAQATPLQRMVSWVKME